MAEERHYYQTNLISKEQKQVYEAIAQSQTQKILYYFWEHPTVGLTCDDIEQLFTNQLLTSIRRSLTNLAHAGKIVKIGQREGQYKRPVNIYTFVKL
jgi:hypothetical protein